MKELTREANSGPFRGIKEAKKRLNYFPRKREQFSTPPSTKARCCVFPKSSNCLGPFLPADRWQGDGLTGQIRKDQIKRVVPKAIWYKRVSVPDLLPRLDKQFGKFIRFGYPSIITADCQKGWYPAGLDGLEGKASTLTPVCCKFFLAFLAQISALSGNFSLAKLLKGLKNHQPLLAVRILQQAVEINVSDLAREPF